MYYTGKENSPLHFGLSAEGYDINSAMEGYDKNIWIVELKNTKKVWIRKDSIVKITKEEPLINEVENTNNIYKEKSLCLPTDYNIYIKYRLYFIKNDLSNDNKGDFNSVRAEWQDLKKDQIKMKDIMVEARKWFENIKDNLPKKNRQRQNQKLIS
tara:strand:- start:1159 stop:1623 length:465 start_codon:yes stop_codon:yes gene_type:complete